MRRVISIVLLAMALALPAAAQDEYPTEEIEALWAEEGSGETMELLVSDQKGLVGLRDEDFCHFMATLLRVEPTTLQLSSCATVLERTFAEGPQIWLPESMLRVVAPPPGQTHDLGGVLALKDRSGRWKKGKPCRGRRGYDDIRPGMQLRVRDAGGTLLGVGELGRGVRRSASECWFAFTIKGLPEVSLYELESGRRGTLAWSLSDLEEQDWIVSISIG